MVRRREASIASNSLVFCESIKANGCPVFVGLVFGSISQRFSDLLIKNCPNDAFDSFSDLNRNRKLFGKWSSKRCKWDSL